MKQEFTLFKPVQKPFEQLFIHFCTFCMFKEMWNMAAKMRYIKILNYESNIQNIISIIYIIIYIIYYKHYIHIFFLLGLSTFIQNKEMKCI